MGIQFLFFAIIIGLSNVAVETYEQRPDEGQPIPLESRPREKRKAFNDNYSMLPQKQHLTDEYPFETKKLYYSIIKYSKAIPKSVVNRIINKAFNAWSSVSGLKFVRVRDNESAADIKLGFFVGDHGDGSPFINDSVMAHASNRDVHFRDITMYLKNIYDVILQAVALHEIGHVLGLSHSNRSDVIMTSYHNDVKELTDEDVSRIRKYYGYSFNDKNVPANVKKAWICARYNLRQNKTQFENCMTNVNLPSVIVPGLFNHVYVIVGNTLVIIDREKLINLTKLNDRFKNLQGTIEAAVLNRKKRELHLYAEGMHYAYKITKDERFVPVQGYPTKASAREKQIVGTIEIAKKGTRKTETFAILNDGSYARHNGVQLSQSLGPLAKRFPNLPDHFKAATLSDEPEQVMVFTGDNKVYEYDIEKKEVLCKPLSLYMLLNMCNE